MFLFSARLQVSKEENLQKFVDSIPLEALREGGSYRAVKSWQEKKEKKLQGAFSFDPG
jgi:hypothetical protein